MALDILGRELGIKRLEINGGGVTNGAFLRAGLIDEISLAIFPAVDGAQGAPCVFNSTDAEAGVPAPLQAVTLESSQVLEGGYFGSAITCGMHEAHPMNRRRP